MFDWFCEAWNWAMSSFAGICYAMMMKPLKANCVKFAEPKLTLTYFDIKGLAQATRDTLNYAKISFNDKRVTSEEFSNDIKPTLSFGQLPVLRIDDTVIAQSKTILRYASKLARTYPTHREDAAVIDQWCDLHTDFISLLAINMYSDRAGLTDTGYCSQKHRLWLLNTHIPKYLAILNEELEKNTWIGEFNNVSMADFCWYPTLCWLYDGTFDGVTKETFDAFPNVIRFMKDMDLYTMDSETSNAIPSDSDDDDDAKDTEEHKVEKKHL